MHPTFKNSFGLAACLLLAGCHLGGHLPAANLAEPGWTVRHGQAVWNTGRGEISGEVLLAIRSSDRWVVQFSKSPFVLISGQCSTNRWEIDIPAKDKHYSGRGKPPKQLIWMQLPAVLEGSPPPRGWLWQSNAETWRLENPRSRTWLEGYLDP